MKKIKKPTYDTIHIGKNTTFIFCDNNLYEIRTELPDSYSEDEFSTEEVDSLIEWLQKIRKMMSKRIIFKGQSFTRNEIEELYGMIKYD